MLILWVLLLQLVLARSTTGQKIFAQVGGSVTLTKGYFAETENVYVRWYFSVTGANNNFTLLIWRKHHDPPKLENNGWQSRVSLSEDSSLIISPILERDFNGVFKCEQDNFRSAAEARYTLTRVQMPMNLLLLEGEELSLDCRMESPVKWTAPNGTTYINRLSGNKNILKVPNTLIQDSGVWACETSAGLKFRATTAVTILGLSPPPSDTVYTSVSAFTTLPCFLSADVPWSQLHEKGLQGGSWSFTPPNQSLQQGHQLLTLGPNQTQAWRAQSTANFLSEKEFKSRDLSVQIRKVSTVCRGTYQCSLEFRNKRPMRSTVKLEVLEVLSSAPAGPPLLEGVPVSLNCSLGVPLSSDLQVKWTPPKSSAFSLPKTHGVNLFLPAVSVKDSGLWKCELMKNSVVQASASVTLKIEKLVNTWVIVTIACASIFILLLIITLIIIHRRRKVIITRRKTRFCCCKNPQPKGFYKS